MNEDDVAVAGSSVVKERLCLLMRLTGIPLLIRETLQRRRVTILLYHRLDPETADRHFEVLRHRYTPISLQRFLAARRHSKLDLLPPKPLIITIDDGHRSVRRLKPVLVKHQVPVTVFLCSGLVDTNRPFWFSAPGLMPAARQHLKTVPDEERLAALRALGFDPLTEADERESLNIAEVHELSSFVDFQSHSVSHPILPACSDEKAAEEIARSKVDLEAKLSTTVNALAYPNGSYGQREVQATLLAGYECGVTTRAGFNSSSTPPFELRRIITEDNCGVNELVVRSCGLWSVLRSMLHAIKAHLGSDSAFRQRITRS